MGITKAQQRAVNNYVRRNYYRVCLILPAGEREEVRDHATLCGQSMNDFIRRAIRETMERDRKEPGA